MRWPESVNLTERRRNADAAPRVGPDREVDERSRDVTFLRYPDQGHGFEGAALKDYWKRVNTFFDSYLHPEPPALEKTPVAALNH